MIFQCSDCTMSLYKKDRSDPGIGHNHICKVEHKQITVKYFNAMVQTGHIQTFQEKIKCSLSAYKEEGDQWHNVV
jgi:hypothetical protein